jgi:hypothetical protein
MPIDQRLISLKDTLPTAAPMSVGNKLVAHWEERLNVFDDFINKYAFYAPHLSCKRVERTDFSVTLTANTLPNIQPLGTIDGAVRAAQLFGEDSRHQPIVVIAANAEHIGGSLYRVPRTGDAQEEQAGNTFAGALALATIPGVLEKVENGEMFYSDSYRQSLKRRVAIVIDNVPGTNGKRCDEILVAAPDLSKQVECYSNGIFNEVSYAKEIYRMYCNIFEAIKDKNPLQPIVFNLPGTGVFLGRDAKVKAAALTIQGLCLRQALLDSPAMSNRKIELPFANQQVLNIMRSSNHTDLGTLRLKAVFEQALSDLKKPTHAVTPIAPAQPISSCQFYQEGMSQLAIKFPSQQGRDHFLKEIGSQLNCRLGDNSSVLLLTPSAGKGKSGVYWHRGTLAVNCLNEAIRNQAIQLLGLSSSSLVRCSGTSIHFNQPLLPLGSAALRLPVVDETLVNAEGPTTVSSDSLPQSGVQQPTFQSSVTERPLSLSFQPKECLLSKDEKDALMSSFDKLLVQLNQIKINLTKKERHNHNYRLVIGSVITLYTTLAEKRKMLTDSSFTADDFQTFRNQCITAIGECKMQASRHRGWHRVDPIIRAFLGVLAALTVIPALIMETTCGYRHAFFQTPKTKTLQAIEDLGDGFSANTSK